MIKFSKTIYSICVFVLLTIPSALYSQNNTSSPYSVFGIGDLSNVAYGRNVALGGTGYALRGANFLNLKNPASLTSIDTLSFLFETGVFLKYTQNTSEINRYFPDGNLSHLTFGHRYTPWLMGNYGIMPLSDIGYHFRTIKSTEGEESIIYTDWIGSGGFNKLFYGLGLKISKNFSVGGEAAYIYGPLVQTRKTTALVNPENTTTYYANSRYSGFTFKGGFQFSANLGSKGSNLTLGGVFSPAQQIGGKSFVSIQQSYSSSVTVEVYNKENRAEKIYLPMNYGGGASLIWRSKFLLTADYEFAPWADNNSREYVNQQIFSAGFELLPKSSLKYFERCSYRAGFRYDTGYFTSKGHTIYDMRLSIGAGFPMQKSRSTLNVSLEAGQRGTLSSGLIRERYAKLNLAFSLHDYWFIKRKFD